MLAIGVLELAKPWPLKVVVDNVLGGRPTGWAADAGPPSCWRSRAARSSPSTRSSARSPSRRNYTTISVGQRMVNDFRGDLYAHLQRLSMAFHSRREVGDLLFRLTADTLAIQTLTMNGFFPILTSVVLLGGMSCHAAARRPLTLVALAIVPVLFAPSRRSSAHHGLATDARVKESALWAVAQRTIGAIRVIQAFTTGEAEHRRFVSSSGDLDANLRLYTFQTVYSAFVNVLIAAGTAASSGSAPGTSDGRAHRRRPARLRVYLASLYAPINSLTQTWGLIQGARVGAERVFEILDTAPDLVDGTR